MDKKTPQIRFEGFTDEWEQRKLGELASFSKGAGYTKGDLLAKGKPIILYGRLYTKYETIIENVDTFVEEKEKSVISNGNEVIVPASGESSEDISRASVVAKPGIILGGDLNIVKPKIEIDSSFLALTISNGRQQKELSKKAQGKSIVHLQNSDLKEVNLVYPQKEEQAKIGSFFKNLENTIALHQRKLEKLQQVKKALLQKMFPQKGDRVPDIRFSGFTEDWEQLKLKSLVDITTGKLDANAMNENGKYNFYTSGIKKYKIDVYAFEGPAITIAGNGATVGYMHYANGKFNAYQRTYVLTKFKANREFLFSEIGRNLPRKINQEARTGNIPYIVLDMLTDLQVNVPSYEEQIKIGNFFREIDDIIALQQKQLILLQQLKSAYLQKMFA